MVAGVTLGVKSPCTGVCTLDAATGWCLGCGRTAAEIAAWPGGPPARLAEIKRELPHRLAQLGDGTRT